MMHIFAQAATDILPTGNWSAPTLGGIIIAVLMVLAVFIKMYFGESKETREALCKVVESTTRCIDNNTEVARGVRDQTEKLNEKVDTMNERLRNIKCYAEELKQG